MGWEYCCCAIPVLNVGAYFTLSEQFLLGILVGTLSFSTPSFVGTAVPFGFSNLIVCGLGYAFAAIQLVGFLGIFKEKAGLFRRYVTINWIVLYAGLSVIVSFIAISAARHGQAVDACETAFFSGESTTVEDTKGEQICEIFCWVSVGIMGGLWLLLAIFQSYLVLVLRNYSKSQRRDHIKYTSIYSNNNGESMMLNDRSGLNHGNNEDDWNARMSTESWHPNDARNEYRDNDVPERDTSARYGAVAGSSSSSRVDKKPPTTRTSYGYGVGTGTTSVAPPLPLKQVSVDDAYLEHPEKAYSDTTEHPPPPVPEKDPSALLKEYPPAPPSYETHEEAGTSTPHPLAGGGIDQKKPKPNPQSSTYTLQQPYDPYYPPSKPI